MPRATGICAPATCSCCRPAYHCCPLPLPPPPPPRASHSAACWLWPRGLSARVSPAGPLRRTRVSFTLSFLGKSVVLTSTMSSKHSYARSGERGEKREDGQQGERKSGERRGTWGKESEQTIRQNTGDGRGDPTGTRGEGKERRGERRAKREQSRTERRQVRGEKKEKVRRRRRAPRDDLRERTEKVAQVVSHVNEMAEQKIDRSDLTAVTWLCRFAASFYLPSPRWPGSISLCSSSGAFVRSPQEALGRLVSPE